MSTAIDALRSAFRDRSAAARRWHESGGQVVGYLCDVVPDELITAGGLFPFRVAGAPDVGTESVDAYVGVYRTPFSSRSKRVGFTTSVLESILRGDLDFLDVLVVPHTRSAVQSIYRELVLAHDLQPPGRIPTLFYLDKAYTDSGLTKAFDRDEVFRMAAAVEEWTGRPLSPAALRAATADRNAVRRLLARVSAARRADPPTLLGSDALRAFSLAQALPSSEAIELLTAWLATAQPEVGPPRARVLLAGSPQDHPAVYELIEACGATVVADDHCWGDRCAVGLLREEDDPLSAIAERFHDAPACSLRYPFSDDIERFAARVKAARVDAVVFYVLEGDDLQLWETPEQVAAVCRLGLPVLHLPAQPYAHPDPEAADRLTAFLSALAEDRA